MSDWKKFFFHPRRPSFLEYARQALSSTERGYDLLAEKFDYSPFRTSDPILEGVSHYIAGYEKVGSALDICCGTGAVTGILLDHAAERVIGLDFSEGMLRVGKRNLSEHPNIEKLEWIQADALDMPFVAEFDTATNFGGLGHIRKKDIPRFLDQVYRVLKPGGKFIFVTIEDPSFLSFDFWSSYFFNMAMHIRNALVSPPFIMYYLTFLLPGIRRQLEEKGFSVEVRSGLFSRPYHKFKLVIAQKNGTP